MSKSFTGVKLTLYLGLPTSSTPNRLISSSLSRMPTTTTSRILPQRSHSHCRRSLESSVLIAMKRASPKIKAICSIGRSTKGVVDRTKGFIGEKGIGFKSSFKVTNVVHIASGPFQFKFDRRQTLGMIAPIPEPFPQGQRLPGQTQILLYLNSQDEVTIIGDELKTIRSQLLIFLRKLSAITVKGPSRDIQFRISRKSYDSSLKG